PRPLSDITGRPAVQPCPPPARSGRGYPPSPVWLNAEDIPERERAEWLSGGRAAWCRGKPDVSGDPRHARGRPTSRPALPAFAHAAAHPGHYPSGSTRPTERDGITPARKSR